MSKYTMKFYKGRTLIADHTWDLNESFLDDITNDAEQLIRAGAIEVTQREFVLRKKPELDSLQRKENEMKVEVSEALPADHPMMKAWNKFCETDEFKTALMWAVATKYSQAGHTARINDNISDLQREQHVKGSMWLAFTAGMEAVPQMTFRPMTANMPDKIKCVRCGKALDWATNTRVCTKCKKKAKP